MRQVTFLSSGLGFGFLGSAVLVSTSHPASRFHDFIAAAFPGNCLCSFWSKN